MLSQYGKSNSILSFEDLVEMTGYTQPHMVAGCLAKQNVKYLLGKHGRPWTTIGAIELAMGATVQHQEIEQEKPKRGLKIKSVGR